VANRAQVPWIVVSIHKPLYCSVIGSPSFAAELEEIMFQYDVDLLIVGHMHCYERIHPVKGNVPLVFPVKKDGLDTYYSTGYGPVLVVQGNTGAMQAEKFEQPQPDWSARRWANGYRSFNRTKSVAGFNEGENEGVESTGVPCDKSIIPPVCSLARAPNGANASQGKSGSFRVLTTQL
jgi:hypothetical protein